MGKKKKKKKVLDGNMFGECFTWRTTSTWMTLIRHSSTRKTKRYK